MAAIVAYTLLAGAEASVVRAAVDGRRRPPRARGRSPVGCGRRARPGRWGLLLADPGMVTDIGLQLSLAATAGLLALGGPAEEAVRRLTAGEHRAGSARRWASRWPPSWRRCRSSSCTSDGSRSSRRWRTWSSRRSCRWRCSAPSSPRCSVPLLVAPVGHLVRAPSACWPGCRWRPWSAAAHLLAGVPLASVELPAPVRPPRDRPRRRCRGRRTPRCAPDHATRGPWTAHDAGRPRSPRADPASDAIGSSPSGPRRLLVASFCARSVLARHGGPPAGHRSRHRPGRRHPPRVVGRPADARRRRPRSGPARPSARRADPALGPPHRPRGPDPPARGPRRLGCAGLVPRYRVDRIAETGMASDGAAYSASAPTAADLGIAAVRLAQGDRFGFGSARVEVVWPPPEHVPETAPSTGRGGQRHLDRPRSADRPAAHPAHGRPRGGRATPRCSTSSAWTAAAGTCSRSLTTAALRPRAVRFLDALRPRLAVDQRREGNDYGHPDAGHAGPARRCRCARSGARTNRARSRGTRGPASDDRRPRGWPSARDRAPSERDDAPLRGLTARAPATLARCRCPPDPRPSHCSCPPHRRHGCFATSRSSPRSPRSLPMRARRAGLAVDRRLVETAALLHDVDKALPPDDPVRALGHGEAGAEWLREAGHPELVARGRGPPGHAPRVDPMPRMGDDGAARRAHRRLRRQAGDPARRVARPALRALARQACRPRFRARARPAHAEQLEGTLCTASASAPEDVERLRWVEEALAHAEANGALKTAGE